MRLPVLAILAVLATLLSACVPPPAAPNFPEIAFRDREPFRLDVAEVTLVESYQAPLRAPHVEHESPMPPAVPLRNWVRDRLRAEGGAGSLRATIVDARIVETLLEINQDVGAALTTEQAVRFDGRVEMRLEVLDAGGRVRASVNAEASRARTIPENATLRERDEVLFQIAEDLATDLDAVLAPNIRQHLAPYLR